MALNPRPFVRMALFAVLVAAAALGCNDRVTGPSGTSTGGGGTGGGGGGTTPSAPHAAFRATPASTDVPSRVTFTDASTGSISSWNWSFGDGSTSSARNPVHTYTSPGAHTVRLTVTGPGGSSVAPLTLKMYQVITVSSGSYTFFPPHTLGDCEFDGHGPNVQVTGTLSAGSPAEVTQGIYLRLSMTAAETRSDWTTASGSANYLLHRLPVGIKVKQFLVNHTGYTIRYLDTDIATDYSNTEIGTFAMKGDTEGNDVCGRTADDTHVTFLPNFKVRVGPE